MARNEARLQLSPGLGPAELERLHDATAAAVGLGVIGGQLTHHLALLGVGLVAIDPGVVEAENLANQGFPASSLGEAKSRVRARQLAALNPQCRITTLPVRIEDLGLGMLAGCDVIVTGLDSRGARARANEIAWRLGIPWVDAAVDGTGRWLRGTVTLYDPSRSESPCYLCRFDQSDLTAMAWQRQGQGCPSWRGVAAPAAPPTLQASTFGGIVAGYQALWVIRALLGRTEGMAGRQLSVACDDEPRTEVLTLRRQPRCLFDHQRFEPLRAGGGETLGDLLAIARVELEGDIDALVFHGRNLVCDLVCSACGERRETLRLAESCGDGEVACGCAPGREMAPVMLTSHLAATIASRHARRSWRDLGLPARDIVTARSGSRSAHYVVNDTGQSPGPASGAPQTPRPGSSGRA